jgi:beta-lactam-binding protein with PASTA domain
MSQLSERTSQSNVPASHHAVHALLERGKRALRAALALALLSVVCLTNVNAAPQRFTLQIDSDSSALTGCQVATVSGVRNGVETKYSAVVDTAVSPPRIARLEAERCTSGTFGTPTVYDAGPIAIEPGAGAGQSALNLWFDQGLLATSPARAFVTSANATGERDVTGEFTIAARIVSPQASGDAIPVPMPRALALGLALCTAGYLVVRRRHYGLHVFVVALSVAALSGIGVSYAILVNGFNLNWGGVEAVIVDPSSDAAPNADVAGVFYQRNGDTIFVRIDADIRPDAAAAINAAPVVAGLSANYSLTLPNNSLALAPSVTDDGLPNPPAALSYSWSRVSGPADGAGIPYPVSFNTAASRDTTASFGFGGAGNYVLRLVVSDGALSTSRDVAVTVNDTAASAPIIAAIPDKTVKVGDTLRFALAANDPNFTQTLSYSLLSSPSGAALSGAGNAVFNFTPSKSQVGSHPVSVRVADNTQPNSLTAQRGFNITVVDANLRPKFTEPSKAGGSTPASATFTRSLSAIDPDAGDTLTYSLVIGPPGMAVSAAGALSWVASATVSIQAVTIKVTDSAGNIDVARFNIAVLPSAAPVAVDDAYRVQVGQTLNVNAAQGVLANDVDPAGLPLSASKQSDLTKGSLTSFNANGSFSYTAPAAPATNSFNPELVKQLEIYPTSGIFNWHLADVNGDGHADLIFMGTSNAGLRGQVNAFDIKNNQFLWQNDGSADGCWPAVAGKSFKIAVADIDDDGIPDIVTVGHCAGQNTPMNRVLAFNGRTGALKWRSDNVNAAGVTGLDTVLLADFGQPLTIARLRAGEKPSIVLGVSAFGNVALAQDGIGNVISRRAACEDIVKTVPDGNWTPDANSPPHYYTCVGAIVLNGENGSITQRMIADAGLPGISTIIYGAKGNECCGMEVGALVGDFDNSGHNKITVMGAVWNLDGTLFGTSRPESTWATALGNFDDTPDIEIVSINKPQGRPVQLRVTKADGHVLWSIPIPTVTHGHITVTDLDGDGKADILVNMSSDLWAFDHRGRVRWIHAMPCGDCYFRNGSNSRPAAFDFDGDGVPEVVTTYRNELRFIDGLTGTLKASRPTLAQAQGNGVWAYDEIARVVDADADGHADVIVLSSPLRNVCCSPLAITSVMMFSDAAKQWRPTRKIDNQWQYQGSNVNDDGTVPVAVPLPNGFATASGNIFGTQPQTLTPVDPRLRDQTSFTYTAGNGALNSAAATINITIEPQNRPPRFTSSPPVRHNGSLSYQASAVDADIGDTVTYSLVWQSDGAPCSMNASSGLLTCANIDVNPVNSQANPFFVIAATDGFGARALQTFQIAVATGSCNVPNLLGLTQAAAASAITTAGCSVGEISESTSVASREQVISQTPIASTVILGGEAVSLVVSKGPAPVAVPLVIGLDEGLAVSRLGALSFTAQTTRQFSASVPFGAVIGQSPAAGTSVSPSPANPVNIVVSAGNGLSLSVDKSLLNAGQSATLIPRATDVNGLPATLPSLTYSVVAKWLPTRGSTPTITGTTLSTVANAMGVYTVTATDSVNLRSASVDVAITLPRPADAKSNGAVFADLFQTLEDMDQIGQQLIAARVVDNETLMRSLLTSYVNRWRQTDLARLKLAQPMPLPVGFMPDEARMRSFGFVPTANDLLVQQILSEASNDIRARTAALRQSGTSLATLRALNTQFATKAARMSGLQISEIGGVISHPEIVQLLGRDIPEFYEAFTDDLAVVVGLPRRTPRYEDLKRGTTDDRVKSTLAEQLVKIAVDEVIDEVKKRASETWANTKLFATQTAQFAAWNAAAVATTGYLKKYLYMKDLVEVVSGASLSYRVFDSPFAFIEVESPTKRHHLYTTYVIGPSLLADVNAGFRGAIAKFEDAMSYGKDAVSNPNAVRNSDDLFKIHDEFKEKVDAFFESASSTQRKFVERLYQSADSIEPGGCVFSSVVPCQQLTYPDGFKSVYEYSPPAGFSGVIGIPAAIIFMVQDNVTGEMFIKTVAFMPTPKPAAP